MNHIVAKKSLINSIEQFRLDAHTVRSIIKRLQIFRDRELPISEYLDALRRISRDVIRMSWAKNSVIDHNPSSLPWPTLINLERLENSTLEEYLLTLAKGNNLDVLIEKLYQSVFYAEEQIEIQKQKYKVLATISAYYEKFATLTQGLKDDLDAAEKEQFKTDKQARKQQQQPEEAQKRKELQTRKPLQAARDIYSHMDTLKQCISNSEKSGEVPKLALQLLAQLNLPTISIVEGAVNPELIEDLVYSLLMLLNSCDYLNTTKFQDSWLGPLIAEMKSVLALPRSKMVEAFIAKQQQFHDVSFFIDSSDYVNIIIQILNIAYKPLATLVKDESNYYIEHHIQLSNSLKLLQLFIKGLKPTTAVEAALRERACAFSGSILSILEGNRPHAGDVIKEINEFNVCDDVKGSKAGKEVDSTTTEQQYLSHVSTLKELIKICISTDYSGLKNYSSSLSNAQRIYSRYYDSSLSMDKRDLLDKMFNTFTEINLQITTLQKSKLPESLFLDIITLVNKGLINNASVDDNSDIRINGEIASFKHIAIYVSNRANWTSDYQAPVARKIQKAAKDESIPDIPLKELYVLIKKSKADLDTAQKKAAAILEADAAPEKPMTGLFKVLNQEVLLSAIKALEPTLMDCKEQLCKPIDIDGSPPEEILKRAYHKKLIEFALELIHQVCFPTTLVEHQDLATIHRLAILRATSVLGEIFYEMRGASYYINHLDVQRVYEWRNILLHFAMFKNSNEVLLSYVKNGSVIKGESAQASAKDAGIDAGDDNPAQVIETLLTVLQHEIFNKDKFQSLPDEYARLLELAQEYMLTFAGGDLIRALKLSPRFLEFNTLSIHTQNKMGILSATNIITELQLTRNKYAHAPLLSSLTNPSHDKALMLRMYDVIKSVRGIKPVKPSDLDLVQKGVIPAMQLCWVILVLTNKDGSLREDLESWIQKNIDQFARLLTIKLKEEAGADAWLLQVEGRINQLVTEYGDPGLQAVLHSVVAADHGAGVSADSASAGVKRFGLFSRYCRNVHQERSDQWHQLLLTA